MAAAAAENDETMAEAVRQFRRDIYAQSTSRSREFELKTWASIHDMAFKGLDPPVPLLPLTPEVIEAVGALFKAGQYLSFKNYLSCMRIEHQKLIVAGPHVWSWVHQRAFKDAVRSVERGS